MKHIRTLSISLLLLSLYACQPARQTTPDPSPTLDPNPTAGDSAPDGNLTPGTQSLQKNLSEAGAEVALEGSIDQPFFSTSGQIISINGEPVQVFEYTDPVQADADAGQVAPDGSSIGTTMLTWIGAPHFFRTKQLNRPLCRR